MPLYIFEHPETKAVIEILQPMKSEHVYVDEDGTKWNRVFSIPNASIDTTIDPFDGRAFAEKTGKKSGTIGDLWDESKKASEAREKMLGYDPVKKKKFEEYSKERQGLKHLNDPSRKSNDKTINL